MSPSTLDLAKHSPKHAEKELHFDLLGRIQQERKAPRASPYGHASGLESAQEISGYDDVISSKGICGVSAACTLTNHK
jgi:hypothetical protein